MEQLQMAEPEIITPVADDQSTDTQQELLALLGKKRKRGYKKYLLPVILVILLLVALIIWRLMGGKSNTSDTVTYRQYTVQRGDVIVGSSESSSISLSR